MLLEIKRLDDRAVLPGRGHDGDVGLDLTVTEVRPGSDGVYMARTGIAVQPQPGFYVEVVARSSLPKRGWALANSVGIIDPAYRGEVMLALMPLRREPEDLSGVRAAQLIVRQIVHPVVLETAELTQTARADGGFGSTGR